MTRIQHILISVLAPVVLLLTVTAVQATDVSIDVMPGDETSSIDPLSRGVIPVAILGSDSFDVEDVVVETLAFCSPPGTGATGCGRQALPVHRMGGHEADVNDDGYMDLLSHYRTEDAELAFGDTEACVSGSYNGTTFLACDDIKTVPACGIGFELAFLLPPLMWLRQRRRRIAFQ